MTFFLWLAKQRRRDDPVGDLARDVERDSGAPGLNNEYVKWREHLLFRRADFAALQALRQAWREYRHTQRIFDDGTRL